MPQFRYVAVNAEGVRVNGLADADNLSMLQQALRGKGLFCTGAKEVEQDGGSSKVSIKRVKTKELAVFCRQFATLITSGVTVVKGLDVLYQQTDDKNLKQIIGRIYDGVQKGELLSVSFRKQKEAFPSLLINMIEAGEASGTLDTVMNRMAAHFEKENKLQNKIKSAMTYPMVLACVAVVVVIVLITFVLPTFTNMITNVGGKVPPTTQFLMGVADFLKGYWYIVIGVLVLGFFLWRAFLRSESGRLKWDTFKLKVPILKKSLVLIYSARLTRTFSTLLFSGIQMLSAIEITSRIVGNQLIMNQMMSAREEIRKGITLSSAFKRITILPPMLQSMIMIGEESGMLDSVLEKTANFYDEESDSAIQRLVGLLEPLMIVVMAVIIGFVVISIALPMFGMYGAIGG